jgi:glycogen debranching enzyme
MKNLLKNYKKIFRKLTFNKVKLFLNSSDLDSLIKVKTQVDDKVEKLIIKEAALQLLDNNTCHGIKNGKKYTFSVPSLGTYPFQWFWDSCFHAIAWTYFDINRAKEEIKSLLAWQYKDGFIPHVIFWDKKKVKRWITSWHMQESKGRFRRFIPFYPKPDTSHEIQPPLIAQAVMRIFESDQDKEFLKEVVPKLNFYYRWLFENRDSDRDGLISIISSLESGLDCSPAYDPVLKINKKTPKKTVWNKNFRVTLVNKFVFNYDFKKILLKGPFNIEDVLINAILALNLDMLADLNKKIGNRIEREEFRYLSRKVSNALIKKCWDPQRKLFFNLCGNDEKIYPVVSIQSIFPIIIPWLPKKLVKNIVEHIENPKEFWAKYPICSVAKSEYSFTEEESRGTGNKVFLWWRGTSWVNTNWYIAKALRKHGYVEIADKLTETTKEMIEKGGFREHYNPRTGEGYGAKNFGWSTLVIDMQD